MPEQLQRHEEEETTTTIAPAAADSITVLFARGGASHLETHKIPAGTTFKEFISGYAGNLEGAEIRVSGKKVPGTYSLRPNDVIVVLPRGVEGGQ